MGCCMLQNGRDKHSGNGMVASPLRHLHTAVKATVECFQAMYNSLVPGRGYQPGILGLPLPFGVHPASTSLYGYVTLCSCDLVFM